MRAFIIVLGLSVLASLPAFGQVTMNYQGVLTSEGGEPINATRQLTFRMYRDFEGGEAAWTEVHGEVDVVRGSFAVELGSVEPLPVESGGQLHLSVQVEAAEEFSPRMLVGGALRAQWAAVAAQAEDVAGRDIHPASVSIGEDPVIDAAGRWVGDPTGLSGPAGLRGSAGAQGEAGPAGAQGEAGPAGAQGEAGTAGTQGEVGAAGPRGEAGPGGPRGDPGPAGLQGTQGEVGAAGPRGEVGAVGPPGPHGAIGAQGLRGEVGLNGQQGPQGDAGAVGPQGGVGPRGEVGPVGPQGPPADLRLDTDNDGFSDWAEISSGSDPLDPNDSPSDLDGDGVADLLAGPVGPEGGLGPRGLRGEMGLQGDAGQQGPQGPPGADGVATLCSVVENQDGSFTMTCPDGSRASWSGAPGECDPNNTVLDGSILLRNAEDIRRLQCYTEVTGSVLILGDGDGNRTPSTFVHPTLTRIGGRLELGDTDLEVLRLPALEVVGEEIDIHSTYQLREFDLGGLRTCGELSLSLSGSRLPSVSLPNLESVNGNFRIGDTHLTESLSLPLLESVGGSINIGGHSLMENLSVPSLISVGSFVRIASNAALCTSVVDAIIGQLVSAGWADRAFTSGNDDGC
jgi:hypothetical protein